MAIDLRPWRIWRDQLKQKCILGTTLFLILLLISSAWMIRRHLLKINQQIALGNAYLSEVIQKYDVTHSLKQLQQQVKQFEAQIRWVHMEQMQQRLFWQTMELITEKMFKNMRLLSLTVMDNQFILIGVAPSIAAVNQYMDALLKANSLQSVQLVDMGESLQKNTSMMRFKIIIKSKYDDLIGKST